MNKDDAVVSLIKRGFDAVNSSGVVIVRYSGGSYAECLSKVRQVISEIGYNSSWGVVYKGENREASEVAALSPDETKAVLDGPVTDSVGDAIEKDTASVVSEDAVQFEQLSFF